MVVKDYESPCGMLYLASIGSKLCLSSWHGLSGCKDFEQNLEVESDYQQEWNVLEKAESELEEYFRGERHSFDIPLKLYGTEFQKRVWEALLSIPYGTTVSYGRVASMIGKPGAVRAVAGACNKNPLAIFVPCHRVTGQGGKLRGYAGGLEKARKLIDLEKTDSLFDSDEMFDEKADA